MNAKSVLANALNMARIRMVEVPSFPLYSSIVSQLEYASAVLSGADIDRSKLKKIIVGYYGAREFEESDPDFAQILKDAQLIITKMAKGLKV